MPMGRPRKPSVVKKLEGNRGRRKIGAGEPEPTPGRPTCPPHLSASAKAEWKRIVPELEKMGLLSQVDRSALAAYCQAYGEWVKACKEVDAVGFTIETDKGNTIQNPTVGVMHKAAEQMHKFLVEFGMTPSSRTRINVNKLPGKEDPMDKAIREAEQRRKN